MFVENWTDLCIKGLTELAAKYKGPWSEPLSVPTHHGNGMEIEPPLLSVAHENGAAGQTAIAVRPGKPHRNGKPKKFVDKEVKKKMRKKFAARRARK